MEDEIESWKALPLKELERQLSPNLWNPSKNKLKIITDHLQFIDEGSSTARSKLSHDLDIVYGENDAKFDVYGTNLPSNSTVFFWVHGGGWQLGSKKSSSFFAQNVVRAGVICVVVGYNLAPEVKIQSMRSDIRNALKKSMMMFPKSKFVIGGHSAGAHLTASILHTNSDEFSNDFCKRIHGFYLLSGVYDMRLFIPTYVNTGLQMTQEDSEELSPLLKKFVNPNFKKAKCRIVTAVGEFESPLFKLQTTAYTKHLQNLQLNAAHYESLDEDHFSVVEKLMNQDSFCWIKLRELLKETMICNSRLSKL